MRFQHQVLRIALGGAALAAVAGCAVSPIPAIHVKRAKPAPKLTREFAIPVLMYHRVAPLSPQEERNELVRDLTVLPEDFEEQVRYLKESGYETLSVYDLQGALLKNEPLPEKGGHVGRALEGEDERDVDDLEAQQVLVGLHLAKLTNQVQLYAVLGGGSDSPSEIAKP